jgi:hypothetical protein
MAKKASPFSGLMADWEPVATPSEGTVDSSDRPLSKPDRVAKELDVLTEKYGKNAPEPLKRGAKASLPGNPHPEHATLVRMKKKGSLDSDVNAKTFVVSDNKIVGYQG